MLSDATFVVPVGPSRRVINRIVSMRPSHLCRKACRHAFSKKLRFVPLRGPRSGPLEARQPCPLLVQAGRAMASAGATKLKRPGADGICVGFFAASRPRPNFESPVKVAERAQCTPVPARIALPHPAPDQARAATEVSPGGVQWAARGAEIGPAASPRTVRGDTRSAAPCACLDTRKHATYHAPRTTHLSLIHI